MRARKNRGMKVQRLKVLLILALLYLFSTVGYYFLPWSVRQSVYMLSPGLDRALRSKGYEIVEGWDGLGLWGRDHQAAVEPAHRGDHAYGGVPVAKSNLELLENEGYVVGYSEALRNPLWVAYRVFDVPTLEHGSRPSFRMDRRTDSRVPASAYKGSGYDRGHMAPNYAIATRYGVDGQRETFLMSNIIPQTPRINRNIWKDLEKRVAECYGRYFGEVWVTTGPVFSADPKRLDSGVAIPMAYYKIIADEKGGTLRVKAFLIESDCPPYSRTKSQLVSVDKIEALTGLDFFAELPVGVQAQLESKPAGRMWPWIGAAIRYR